MFLPGVPSIYYGDEFGFEAVKEQRPGGDESVRPELPSERWLFANASRDVESTYRQMIGLRRRHPWLVDAIVSTTELADAHVGVQAQARSEPDSRLTLVLNLGVGPYALPSGATVVEASAPLLDGGLAADTWVVLAG